LIDDPLSFGMRGMKALHCNNSSFLSNSMPRVFSFTRFFGAFVNQEDSRRTCLDFCKTLKELKGCKYIFSGEKGVSSDKLHAQGFISFDKDKKSSRVQSKLQTVLGHVVPAHDIEALRKYVRKTDETHICGPYSNYQSDNDYTGEDLPKTWTKVQEEMKRIILSDTSDRSVTWFWDPMSHMGKTKLAKWFVLNHDAMLIGYSDAENLKFAICKSKPKLIIVNLAWSKPSKVGNADLYSVCEGAKDGVLFSGKYDSKSCIWNGSKVVVFANIYPSGSSMGAKRFDIWKLDGTLFDGNVTNVTDVPVDTRFIVPNIH